jgi:hypothetical protein
MIWLLVLSQLLRANPNTALAASIGRVSALGGMTGRDGGDLGCLRICDHYAVFPLDSRQKKRLTGDLVSRV